MWHSSSVAVVVPAFNVARHLARVLRTMPPWVDHVLVIDDGSTDDTAFVARNTGDSRMVLVQHERNRGVGAALATGYERALELGAEVLAVMAGDGQMDPADLHAVVAPVAEGRAEYAKGNRLRHPSVWRVMPPTRLVGNTVLSALTRWATGLWHVGDSQCGYTALHRRVFSVLSARAMWTRYGYPNHLLGALGEAGFRVLDVVVRPVYADERSGVRVRDAVVTIPSILGRIALARWRRKRLGTGGFVPLGEPRQG